MALLSPIVSFSGPIKEKKLLELIIILLKKSHVKSVDFNDDFSKKTLQDFINSIDPEKHFFLQSDIEEFKKHESKIDDYIKKNDLDFFNLVFNRISQRMMECMKQTTEICNTPNDLSIIENRDENLYKINYPKDDVEHKEKMRLEIKDYILNFVVNSEKDEIQKKLKDSKYISKSLQTIEKEARDACYKMIDRSYDNIQNIDRDYFFDKYLNAIISQFDQHSYYQRPGGNIDLVNYESTGKIVGLGIVYGYKNNQIVIKNMLRGGPAFKDKKLEIGDVILKVSEDNQKTIDLDGFNHYDLFKLLKGKTKGSLVSYTVKKKDGSIKVIDIKRDDIEFEESYVKSCFVDKNGKKYGIISIPKFYENLENVNSRNVYKDLEQEIEFLNINNVKGLVIDLRGNRIGNIETVKKSLSLFIKSGPIAQIQNLNKEKITLSNSNTQPVWDGTIVVLVNSISSFTSEVFATTIKDYNRGIIMGSETTFGKGTIQNLFDLNLFNDKISETNYGSLNISNQKWYRVNGKSVQKSGLSCDISMPNLNMNQVSFTNTFNNKTSTIEKFSTNSIPNNSISELKIDSYTMNDFSTVIAESKKRISENVLFDLIEKKAKLLKTRNLNSIVKLNLEEFKKDQKMKEEESKVFEALSNYKSNLIFNYNSETIDLMKKNEAFEKKMKVWQETLSKDIEIEESINVLDQMKSN